MSEEKDVEKQLNKRIDDLKWFVGIFSGSVAFLMVGLSLIVGLNLNSEKQSLKEFRAETIASIDKKLGQMSNPPKINLLNVDGGILSGAMVEVRVTTDEKGNGWIHIPYRLQNVGGDWTGKLFGKVYANKPVCLPAKASLNSEFETEAFIDESNYKPKQLPPGVSIQASIHFPLSCEYKPDTLAKMSYVLSYGNALTSEATFNVIYRAEK